MKAFTFHKEDNPDYPYENPRPHDEVVASLTSLVNGETDFVLASILGDFGDAFLSHIAYTVHIQVPREMRLKRVFDRSYTLFGEKCNEGEDYYDKIKSFHAFCAARDERMVANWLATVHCPTMQIDEALPIASNLTYAAENIDKII